MKRENLEKTMREVENLKEDFANKMMEIAEEELSRAKCSRYGIEANVSIGFFKTVRISYSTWERKPKLSWLYTKAGTFYDQKKWVSFTSNYTVNEEFLIKYSAKILKNYRRDLRYAIEEEIKETKKENKEYAISQCRLAQSLKKTMGGNNEEW